MKCPECAKSRVEPATIASAGVWPDRASALKKAFTAAELKATVCLECGAVFGFRTDVERFRKMLPK